MSQDARRSRYNCRSRGRREDGCGTLKRTVSILTLYHSVSHPILWRAHTVRPFIHSQPRDINRVVDANRARNGLDGALDRGRVERGNPCFANLGVVPDWSCIAQLAGGDIGRLGGGKRGSAEEAEN